MQVVTFTTDEKVKSHSKPVKLMQTNTVYHFLRSAVELGFLEGSGGADEYIRHVFAGHASSAGTASALLSRPAESIGLRTS